MVLKTCLKRLTFNDDVTQFVENAVTRESSNEHIRYTKTNIACWQGQYGIL